MIQKVEMFTVDCDNCGKNADEDSDYSCWNDEGVAVEIAMDDHDFIEHEGKHYCPDCYKHDDKDNIIIDEIRKV